ncbi:MAG: DNA primase [Candidatus Ordinivivax streblomastigis]|uniref:DNA primase n=1 Tax=Candidatus Ordinivivax streblomastigis TaxID=2540710 RepID=A0A5M8P340_9BACT|nr:MAG: DNA primase [Candidatus Ordinivivax streblomastigis]
MYISKSETDFLIAEISRELGAKRDGSNKNLIARCPFCGKEGKFGVYIGKETERKKTFMSHCFSCGYSTTSLEQLLSAINRPDLILTPVADLSTPLENTLLFPLETEEEEIDDLLIIVDLPDFYRRCFSHEYLKSRGFVYDDYDYFPVGTTGRLNTKYNDYVIFPIIDEDDTVGYVARHTLSKDEIDKHNRRAKAKGEYKIMRFRNSTENDFVKLLYNYDAVIPDETDTVILVEGIFDVIALTRKLELYDNTRIAVVATFGKKISRTQIYKLQKKGIETIVIGYDGDAVDAIKKTAEELQNYFEVFIADIEDPTKDWEDLSCQEIYDTFSTRLRTPIEYKMNKIQQ